MAEMGFSFMPGGDNQAQDINLRRGDGALQSPQQAVQLLRLRVPRTLPSNAPVARSLLASPGHGVLGALSPLLQSLVQAFQPVPLRNMTPIGPILSPTDASPLYDTVRSPLPPPAFTFKDVGPDRDEGTLGTAPPPPTGAQAPGFFQRGPGKEFQDVQG